MTHKIAPLYQNCLDECTNRHPSTQHMMKMLVPNANLPDHLHVVASKTFKLAYTILHSTPDSPELTAGLRKLLEAKDCFIRARLDFESVDYREQ